MDFFLMLDEMNTFLSTSSFVTEESFLSDIAENVNSKDCYLRKEFAQEALRLAQDILEGTHVFDIDAKTILVRLKA